jgi:hypothetical protein
VQQSQPGRQQLPARQAAPERLAPQMATHPRLLQLQRSQRTLPRPALRLLLQQLQRLLLRLLG